MIRWSYCSQIHRREARSGQLIKVSNAVSRGGSGGKSSALSGGKVGVGSHGRSYSGAASTIGSIGMSAAVSPFIVNTNRPLSVSRPMTAKSKSQRSKIARASASPSGLRMINMRSWLSDSINS